jgi:hypothetical protein
MEPEGVGRWHAGQIVARPHFSVVTRETFSSMSLDK